MEEYSLKYDEKGDVTQTFVLFTSKNGKNYTVLETLFKG